MIINEMAGSGGDLMPCYRPTMPARSRCASTRGFWVPFDEGIHPLDAVVDTGLQFGPQL
jgi:hypothetical protein